MAVPADRQYSNLSVAGTLVCQHRVVTPVVQTTHLTVPGGVAGDVLVNDGTGVARWSASPWPVSTVNVGVTPAAVGFSADGSRAFVANANFSTTSLGPSLTVVDTTTYLPVDTIVDDALTQPSHVATSADGSRLYVSNGYGAGNSVVILDSASYDVLGTITGFNGPIPIAIVGLTAYVGNYGSNTISIVDLNTNAITGSIVVGTAPGALALSTDASFLYSANWTDGGVGTGTVSVVSLATHTVIATITGFSAPSGITTSDHHAYVSNTGFAKIDTTVSVVDLETHTIVKTLTTGLQPCGVARVGRWVYVTNTNNPTAGSTTSFGTGTVSVIDAETNTVVPPTVVVGQVPVWVSGSPDGSTLWVANQYSNTVTVLEALR